MNPDYHHLLYVLEKVRNGGLHTDNDDPDHEVCLCLERDGLVIKCFEEENGHAYWEAGE